MTLKILDVLKNKGGWPVMGNDLRGIKKERALGVTKKSVRPA